MLMYRIDGGPMLLDQNAVQLCMHCVILYRPPSTVQNEDTFAKCRWAAQVYMLAVEAASVKVGEHYAFADMIRDNKAAETGQRAEREDGNFLGSGLSHC